MSELPEVIDYLGTQWVRMDVVRKQEARLAEAEAAARWCYMRLDDKYDGPTALSGWPWLANETAKGGE